MFHCSSFCDLLVLKKWLRLAKETRVKVTHVKLQTNKHTPLKRQNYEISDALHSKTSLEEHSQCSNCMNHEKLSIKFASMCRACDYLVILQVIRLFHNYYVRLIN